MLNRILIVICLLVFSFSGKTQTYKVEQYGAKADGQTSNTLAIQKKIDINTVEGVLNYQKELICRAI